MSRELTVAVTQMTSIDDVDTNLMQMESLLEEIFKAAQPRLVCFPENCLYLRLTEGEKIQGLNLTDPVFTALAEQARKHSTYLHLGSVPLFVDEHLYNSSVLIHPDGKISSTYQKMHLFDIQLEGQKPIRESDVFRHGQRPHVFEIDGWRVGGTICYDIRFAEIFSQYAKKEVDLLLVPAAFLMKTGEAHWEILLRARAIESQCYLVASAQGGFHRGVRGGTRETYGHSMVVDPWGVMAQEMATPGPAFRVQTLTKEK